MQVQHAKEVAEHKGLEKSSCQPLKLTTSLEMLNELDKEDTGVFYDEMTSSSYPTNLKSSKHSVTLPPTQQHKSIPVLLNFRSNKRRSYLSIAFLIRARRKTSIVQELRK